MCLGIPGQIVEIVDADQHLAKVDVNGVRRIISVRLLAEQATVEGDWVLVHVGFAMAKIDEEEARSTREFLISLGEPYEAELEELEKSRIE